MNMKINIKQLDGREYIVNIYNFVDIYSLKVYLQNITGFKTEKQRLIFCGKELINDQKITDIIGLEKNTFFYLIYIKDDENNINSRNMPRTQKKIIEELQIKVLSLADRIDILEKTDKVAIKNNKSDKNIPTIEDFKELVSNMICNFDSREDINNLKNKTVKYNNKEEFSITYEYRT